MTPETWATWSGKFWNLDVTNTPLNSDAGTYRESVADPGFLRWDAKLLSGNFFQKLRGGLRPWHPSPWIHQSGCVVCILYLKISTNRKKNRTLWNLNCCRLEFTIPSVTSEKFLCELTELSVWYYVYTNFCNISSFKRIGGNGKPFSFCNRSIFAECLPDDKVMFPCRSMCEEVMHACRYGPNLLKHPTERSLTSNCLTIVYNGCLLENLYSRALNRKFWLNCTSRINMHEWTNLKSLIFDLQSFWSQRNFYFFKIKARICCAVRAGLLFLLRSDKFGKIPVPDCTFYPDDKMPCFKKEVKCSVPKDVQYGQVSSECV